ncbi:hypothetical protein [Aminipila terrae]|uniref:Uncharacterized protein n=1 Tax=Aminipila terrae TaxID=2697030 RepID=A0A6P1MHZ4_9FIRM|nr:hypothetical protein [Aminipila terrae]QHI73351.1 hypothetical protein Ami3637_14065 [Aminipila terrae]
MEISNVSGVCINLHNSVSKIDKTAAKKFTEYFQSGSLNLKAMENGGDIIELSNTGNINSKMKDLQKQVQEKNFSAMSETEVFNFIEGAYNRTFPNFRANESLNKELYEKVANQRDEQLKAVLNIQDDETINRKIIELYKKSNGYEGMNPDQIVEKIKSSYSDNRTHLGRAQIVCEKLNTGLISKQEAKDAIKGLQYNLEMVYCRMQKIPRIEDAKPEDFGNWKARYYDGEFLPEKIVLPSSQEKRMEMMTSFGEYLSELKPLIDDFMKITEGKPGGDLTQKKDEEQEKKTMEKVDADPTVVKGSELKHN